MPQSLHRSVKQADMANLNRFRKAVFNHHKAMVLAGDLNPSCVQVTHRVVGSAMPLTHLHCCTTKGQSQQLMAYTNPENRNIFCQQLGNFLFGISSCCGWITRTVRQENPVRAARQNFSS